MQSGQPDNGERGEECAHKPNLTLTKQTNSNLTLNTSQMSIAFVEGNRNGIMKCDVTIDASPEECAAYNYNYTSRRNLKNNDRKDVVHRDAISLNDHSKDLFVVRDFGFGFKPRQFLSRHVWKRTSPEVLVHVAESIDESPMLGQSISNAVVSSRSARRTSILRPVAVAFHLGPTDRYVATNIKTFFSYVKENDSAGVSTKMKYITQMSLGGAIPHKFVNSSAVAHMSDFIR